MRLRVGTVQIRIEALIPFAGAFTLGRSAGLRRSRSSGAGQVVRKQPLPHAFIAGKAKTFR